MKRHKLLSWVLSLVMALTVFSIPAWSAYAGEADQFCLATITYDEDNDQDVYEQLQNEVNFADIIEQDDRHLSKEITISKQGEDGWQKFLEADQIVWRNSDPTVAGIMYSSYTTDDEPAICYEEELVLDAMDNTLDDIEYPDPSIFIVPKKAGEITLTATLKYTDDDSNTSVTKALSLKVNITDNDLVKYCLAGATYNEATERDTFTPYGAEIDFGNMIKESGSRYASMCVCSNESGEWDTIWIGRIEWTNDDPSVAAIAYYDSENDKDVICSEKTLCLKEKSDEDGAENYFSLYPKKEGQVNLSASIYDEAETTEPIATILLKVTVSDDDTVHYRLAGVTFKEGEDDLYTPYEAEMNYSDMIKDQDNAFRNMAICSDEDGSWEGFWTKKLVWHNNSTSVAAIKYWNPKTHQEVVSSNATLTFTAPGEDQPVDNWFCVVPKTTGEVNLSVDVYDKEKGEEIVATIPIKITIEDQDIGAIKKAAYEGYLKWYDYNTDYADYNWKELCGSLPSIKEYNSEQDTEIMKVTEAEVKGIAVEATIGGKKYTTKPKKSSEGDWYEYSVKFAQAAFASSVTVKYTMADAVKTEKICVSKAVTPKITVTNYTYNGKTRYPSFTVKVGSTKLTNGKDYKYDKNGLKNVGAKKFDVWNIPTAKYRFYETKSFKINPKGTSLKTLKKEKKAFTATWTKQAAKMSTSRITGYQIMCATNKAFTKGKKTVTVKGYATTSKKIKKLKKKKTYYVKIRTYKKVGKITYYSPWSKVKTVKTK